jgi:hypothetical protein
MSREGPGQGSLSVEAPPSSRGAAVARRLSYRRPELFLFDLLQGVERMSGTSALMFSSENGPVGEVLVLGRRVGLVTLVDDEVPLSQRLHRRAPETATSVRATLAQARAEGKPLAEVVAALDSRQSGEIRGALLDQIVDGLTALARAARDGITERCVALAERSAPSVLGAFSPAELYWRAATAAERRDDEADRCFRALSSLSSGAALFARRERFDDADVPLAASGLAALDLSEVAQLGRCIEPIARPPALMAAGVQPRITVLSAREDAVLCVSAATQVAIFGGIATEARARVLGEAFRIVERGPGS